MSHILEALANEMEGQTHKKEVSWVLGIHIQYMWWYPYWGVQEIQLNIDFGYHLPLHDTKNNLTFQPLGRYISTKNDI